MGGKGKDESELQHLGGLELERADFQPRLVICALTPLSQRRKAKTGQHQRNGRIDEPEFGDFVVVDKGERTNTDDSQQTGEELCAVVAGAHSIGDAVLPDGEEQENAASEQRMAAKIRDLSSRRQYWCSQLSGFSRREGVYFRIMVYPFIVPSIFGPDCGTVWQRRCASFR